MITRDGLMTAVERLLGEGLEVGLYQNELDGSDVRLSDVKQPKNYSMVMVPASKWTKDPARMSATAEKQELKFSGKAGHVIGYFLKSGDRLISYEPFMDPIPINSDEDVIYVRPRLFARRKEQ
jgi:hypothetical protein